MMLTDDKNLDLFSDLPADNTGTISDEDMPDVMAALEKIDREEEELSSGLPVQEEPVPEAREVQLPISGTKNPLVAPGEGFLFVPAEEMESLEEVGDYLRQVREKLQVSVDDVAGETRIKPFYISALENGNIAELPPPAFTLGYIRKLCNCYRVDTAPLAGFLEALRDTVEVELPDDVSKIVSGRLVDENEMRKRNQLAIAFLGVVLLLVLAVVAGLISLFMWISDNVSLPGGSGVSEKEIVEFQDDPVLKKSVLTPPKR